MPQTRLEPRTGGRSPDWATIPNAVTLVRFVLLLPVCWLLLDDGPETLSVVLLLVWAATDWIDGFLARALHQTSRVGEIIDPIADRLGLVAIVLSLALAGLLPWTALAIIFAVDVATTLLSGRTALAGDLHVSWLGKIRTALLMVGVLLVAACAAWAPAWTPWAQALLWAGVALHVAAGIGYIIGGRRATGSVRRDDDPRLDR